MNTPPRAERSGKVLHRCPGLPVQTSCLSDTVRDITTTSSGTHTSQSVTPPVLQQEERGVATQLKGLFLQTNYRAATVKFGSILTGLRGLEVEKVVSQQKPAMLGR